MSEIQNISGKNTAHCSSWKLFAVSDFMVVPPSGQWVFDTVFPLPDYIEANPKQSLSLITSLTNAPQYPLTDTGGLAELNSQGNAKSVILSKLIGLLK